MTKVFLILSDNLVMPEFVRLDDNVCEIKIGFDCSWDRLKAFVSELVSEKELETLEKIWVADEAERNYENMGNALRISLAD